MPTTPPADGRVTAAAQANLATHMTWLQARTPGMTVTDFGDLLLADSGLATDTFTPSAAHASRRSPSPHGSGM
jgi:hypothetical protein